MAKLILGWESIEPKFAHMGHSQIEDWEDIAIAELKLTDGSTVARVSETAGGDCFWMINVLDDNGGYGMGLTFQAAKQEAEEHLLRQGYIFIDEKLKIML